MRTYPILAKPGLSRTRTITIIFLLLYIGKNPAFGQNIRYIHPVFENVQVTHTFYGSNVSVLASPKNIKVPLPVTIFTPKGDTVKNRPLIIYVHSGNFLPYPTNGGTNGRTSTFGDPTLASLALLGMGFPVDSTLIEICTRLAKMGYVTAAIDYRTGWNPIAPARGDRVSSLINAIYRGVQDLRTVIRYFKSTVKSQGNPFGVDTTKIVGWGEGAGGKITLAASTLDSYTDILHSSDKKFIGGSESNPVPYVIEAIHGDINGTAAGIDPVTGDTLSFPNHVGFGSDFNLCVNMGGSLADTAWLDGSDLPLISYHHPRDPFVPYKDELLILFIHQLIIREQGSYLVNQRADKLGLQKKMRDLQLNDVYTQHANQKNDGIEGLYPITGDNPLDSSPWSWWDTLVITPSNSRNGIITNPNMSAAKARRYIDTILAYFAPRAYAVLNLGTLVTTPDLTKEFEVGFRMMPNPMSGHTTLSTDNKYPMKSITLYDSNGKVLRSLPGIKINQLTLHRNELPPGAYFIQVGFEKGVITKTLLIQ